MLWLTQTSLYRHSQRSNATGSSPNWPECNAQKGRGHLLARIFGDVDVIREQEGTKLLRQGKLFAFTTNKILAVVEGDKHALLSFFGGAHLVHQKGELLETYQTHGFVRPFWAADVGCFRGVDRHRAPGTIVAFGTTGEAEKGPSAALFTSRRSLR